MPLVEVENLALAFPSSFGWRKVLDGVFLWTEKGEDLGLVGTSGSGKSLTLLSLLQLVPPPGRKVGGRVTVKGVDPYAISEMELRRLRGGVVGLVMQAPLQAFNPVLSVGHQVEEAALCHGDTKLEAKTKALELLAAVGLEPAEYFYRAFPHQLSGGEQQRALLASALVASPEILLLDEPTSALDPLAQNAFLALLKTLQSSLGLTLVLASHDLALVARTTKKVVVLAAGETVEVGLSRDVLQEPLHPVTRFLCGLEQEPSLGSGASSGGGCRFVGKCPYALARCWRERAALAVVGDRRWVRCFLHHERSEDA